MNVQVAPRNPAHPNVFIISGLPGSGKTELVKRVQGTLEDVLFWPNHLFREPRKGEVDGRENGFGFYDDGFISHLLDDNDILLTLHPPGEALKLRDFLRNYLDKSVNVVLVYADSLGWDVDRRLRQLGLCSAQIEHRKGYATDFEDYNDPLKKDADHILGNIGKFDSCLLRLLGFISFQRQHPYNAYGYDRFTAEKDNTDRFVQHLTGGELHRLDQLLELMKLRGCQHYDIIRPRPSASVTEYRVNESHEPLSYNMTFGDTEIEIKIREIRFYYFQKERKRYANSAEIIVDPVSSLQKLAEYLYGFYRIEDVEVGFSKCGNERLIFREPFSSHRGFYYAFPPPVEEILVLSR
ncbi:hypothetical protein JXB41_07630 [Candidatus Woesearchaeota archaeon]|nr:hypothetical protein [Candidatus Woesearchaeota archaeon]